jgi:hypothetical protein
VGLNRDLLRIHLNDHLALLAGGVAAAERARSNNAGTPLAESLEAFVRDLREDREHVERVLAALNLSRNPVKPAAAVVAERLGRLKMNGQLTGYSPLSRLVELEGAVLVAEAQRVLWTGLREVAPQDPALASLPYDELVSRSTRWHDDLDRLRLDAAIRALSA